MKEQPKPAVTPLPQWSSIPSRERMRYELARAAIAGIALQDITRILPIAERAVKLADCVLEVLERKEQA